MEFSYSAILRGDIPLVQHCPKPGNFDLFFQRFIEKNDLQVGRTVVLSDGFLWGIQHDEDGLTFLCVINHSNDQSLIDKLIDDIKSRFIRIHGSDWKKSSPFGLQTSFEPQLILVKQSFQSIIGPISNYDQIEIEEEEEKKDSLLNQFENNSKIDATLNDGLLNIKVQPIIIHQNSYNFEIFKWIFLIFFFAFILYLLLVLFCGGFDLRPRCL